MTKESRHASEPKERKFLGLLKRNKKKMIAILAAAAVGTGGYTFWVKKVSKTEGKAQAAQLSVVDRGDIEVTISGSGTVEPMNRYEIIPLVNGEITAAPYEVGDYVEKGTVIYTFDTQDVELSLKKQENSMEKSSITYEAAMRDKEKLSITAPCDGTLTAMSLKAGEKVSANEQVATIIDDKKLQVKLPFHKGQISTIRAGSSATLSSSAQMSTFGGTVTHVDSTTTAQEDGSAVYFVTVEFTNPGAIAKGTMLGGAVNGQVSPGSGAAEYTAEKTVKSDIEGTIAKLNYKEGDYVRQGQVIAVLSSETLDNTLQKSTLDYQDAKLSLEDQKNKLDDYRITAPISGTVLTKNSKLGDTIDKTNASVTMMVIADVSKLKFSLPIDELDVSKVSVGQQVKVTADALEDQQFNGEITEISMEGEASNGVTTYNATITIHEPGDLKPSMNVDAVIMLQSAQNVLRVPTSDIKTAMGHHFVFVKEESTATDQKEQKKNQGKNEAEKENSAEQSGQKPASMPSGAAQDENPDSRMGAAAPPEGVPSGTEQGAPASAEAPAAPSGQKGDGTARQPAAPDGFRVVEITIGIQGDDYTEVISGLSEGQQIYQQTTSSGSNNMQGMPGMGGGMPGGGDMPAGGGSMGGGMPGGGGGGANRSGGMR